MITKTWMTASFVLMSLALPAFAAPTTSHYAIDPAASTVGWEGSKKIVDSKHFGTVTVKSGTIDAQGEQITSGTIEIDMTTIVNKDLEDATYNQKLVTHLKSEDFFDVTKFPTSKFVIKKAKAQKGKGGATHELTGDLTIKSETHPIIVPATLALKDGTWTGKAQITIDRTKWNLRYGSDKFFKSLGDKVISDEIKLDLNLTAKAS